MARAPVLREPLPTVDTGLKEAAICEGLQCLAGVIGVLPE